MRYENEMRENWTFYGYEFTKCRFLNEEKCKASASENSSPGLHDREAFELGVRITLISVIDNRFSVLSRTQQERMLAESVILEPDATLAPTSHNRSIIEDISTVFPSSRLL
ncbi:unnamed protein product [Gongylonema pulchrum]|uniref:Uncharacterized protein n=1 Tax=Gongylonema pulchrum TaxID=637853 RepID=A0A183DSW4_9BILA|nr:unnamed protein product [Gongylonema pulchrum]